jgi:hypothetical protein
LCDFAQSVEILPVSEEDARAYACNALTVGERWLAPKGISAELRERVAKTGLSIVELDLAELFGKGGGGPRCLVNVLPAALDAPAELRYEEARAGIATRIAGYPQEAPTES